MSITFTGSSVAIVDEPLAEGDTIQIAGDGQNGVLSGWDIRVHGNTTTDIRAAWADANLITTLASGHFPIETGAAGQKMTTWHVMGVRMNAPLNAGLVLTLFGAELNALVTGTVFFQETSA